MTQLHVAICGAGRTGHLNAALFARRPGVHVSLLTRNEEVVARLRGGEITVQLPNGEAFSARPDLVTMDAAAAVAQADVVVVTAPAHVRPAVLEAIAEHLPRDKPVHVGAIPGFCGFDWLAAEALRGRPNAVIWGLKDVPHTAFALDPGKSIRMGGAKQELSVGTHRRESHERRGELLSYLQALFDVPVALLDDYMEITLTPGNPIMHSSVIYGLIGPYAQWHGRSIPDPLCWWRDCPQLGAYFLERMDEECLALCRAVESRFGLDLGSVKPLRQEIVEAYGDQIADAGTMLSILRTNRAYDDIPAPLVPIAGGEGYAIDRESRAFHEDVAYGLALLVEMARRLNVRAPHLEEIFAWNVSYMGGLRGSSLAYFPPDWPGEPQ
ncbi:hypothetical protein B6S44_04655 [Bosea sp. Tri-44]|nr:hypothetical protein B6S44_04655 [Bosea sp. Tri-44]